MSQKPYVIDNMISAKSIAARIEQLAAEIEQEFADTDKLVVVGLLRGSFVFIADLVREINLPIEVDFLEVSSYGDAMESSREVRILKDLRGTIENRDVLIVEDIVDTGRTLNYLLENFAARASASTAICTLLDKPSGRLEGGDIKVDYIGFSIPNHFVVGYGLDLAGYFRNLPYVGIYTPPEA